MAGPLDGVLVVDKPRGMTSHDVVDRVRLLVRPARVGHTGTLDPMATGVLVLALGAATRLARFLSAGEKSYEGEIVFGVRTDTDDAEGRVLESRPLATLALEAVRREAGRLTGDLLQVPPAFSAKKVRGRRAYDLARSGGGPSLPPCPVRVAVFDIQDLEGGRARFRVDCSAGTYVRSLARDLGAALACGAHLGSLRRVRNGPFAEEQAHELGAIERAGAAGRLSALVRPLDSLDLGLPAARLTSRGESLAAAGRVVPPDEAGEAAIPPPGATIRLLGPAGSLVALAEVLPGSAGFQPRIVLGAGVA